MKIRITYEEDERKVAEELTEKIQSNKHLGILKVTKSDRNKPFFHTYLATKKRRKSHK